MKIFYLLIFFSFSTLYSQRNEWVKIEYTQILGGQITNSTLFYNQSESVYLFGNQTKIDTTSAEMSYVLSDDIGSVIYKNLNNKILFTRIASKDEVVLVNDEYPVLNWTITSETKNTSNLLLTKAITTFRGRVYIAWFCEIFAGNNGPLKMGGLPGTIVELKTEDGFLNILFNKISFNLTKPDLIDLISTKYDRKISQNQWNYELQKKLNAFKNHVASKQKRNSSIKITFDESLEKFK